MISDLPDFVLERHFAAYEFALRHHLTASDAESMTIDELLALAAPEEREAFGGLRLSYLPTWGTHALRSAIAETYDHLDESHVLSFVGAEEAMFLALQLLVGPGDHAIVTVPNYQSMESVTIATGAEVSGLALWSGSGSDLRWTLDVERLRALVRPNTRLLAVNIPNNPTGFVPDATTWAQVVALCEEHGVRLFSDEVYRGLEHDPAAMIVLAADASPSAISLNVMSKAYGLPGLRIGWLASRDRVFLERVERAKHYTTICNAGPSEFLACIGLRHGGEITARNRAIVAENLVVLRALFDRYPDLLQWTGGDGGCVAFPRYLGVEGVEELCASLIADRGVLLLPASIYRSQLCDVPTDRFRVGFGRRHLEPGWAQVEEHLQSRRPVSGGA